MNNHKLTWVAQQGGVTVHCLFFLLDTGNIGLNIFLDNFWPCQRGAKKDMR